MQIVDAYWTPRVNIYIIQCRCGARFHSPVDLWWHRCPHCQRKECVETIRRRPVSLAKKVLHTIRDEFYPRRAHYTPKHSFKFFCRF